MANADQLDEVVAAAQWLQARNAEVMPGFTLQTVVVHIQPPGDPDPTHAAQATFTWQGDHYALTLQ